MPLYTKEQAKDVIKRYPDMGQVGEYFQAIIEDKLPDYY